MKRHLLIALLLGSSCLDHSSSTPDVAPPDAIPTHPCDFVWSRDLGGNENLERVEDGAGTFVEMRAEFLPLTAFPMLSLCTNNDAGGDMVVGLSRHYAPGDFDILGSSGEEPPPTCLRYEDGAFEDIEIEPPGVYRVSIYGAEATTLTLHTETQLDCASLLERR